MNSKIKIPLLLTSLALAINLAGCGSDSSEPIVIKPEPPVVIAPGEADRASSVWLRFNDEKSGDTIMQDIYVPKKGLTPYTYYSVLNWNAGMEGGGYAGIQDHPDGRNFIFSIWDPSNGETITAPYAGEGTVVENFGGEGTGLKSWNFALGWEPDTWYTLVAKVWDENEHTFFGYWSQNKTTGKWTHLVTMDYPVAKVRFNSNTGTFIEDWLGTGNHSRSALFSNGYKRSLDGSWEAFTQATFEVVHDEGHEEYHDNYNATSTQDYYRMTTGGDAAPKDDEVDNNAENHKKISRLYIPRTPLNEATEVSISSVTNSSLTWVVPAGATPQLKQTVLVNGTQVASKFDSSATTITFDVVNNDDVIELQIENILGKVTYYTATVNDGVMANDDTVIIDQTADKLLKNEPVTIEYLSKGESLLFEANSLISSTGIVLALGGGTGDADLYVKKGEIATPDNYDCASIGGGNFEMCISQVKKEEQYYALVVAKTDVANVNIVTTQDGSDDGMLNSATFILTAETPAQPGNEIKFAFDNDPETIWHTSWGDDKEEYPHAFVIDLGKEREINRFEYTPRKGGGNGTIVAYEIYISNTSSDFGEAVYSGTWPANGNLKLDVFDPFIPGRFIRFVALEEKGGGAWASAAEFRVGEVKEGIIAIPITGEDGEEPTNPTEPEAPVDNGNIEVNSTLLDNTTFAYTGGTAAQSGNELSLAFDGDSETFWHTSWDDSSVAFPHDVVIDLGANYQVNRFDYAPRIGGGNGTVVEYELYVSEDGIAFGDAVSSGSWAGDGTVKTATFAAKSARYVKFLAIAEKGGNPWAAASEINVGVDMTVTLDSSTFVVSSTSAAQPGNELALAFDNDTATFWHTNWDDSSVVYPHEVTIDLVSSQNVVQFQYVPRVGGGNGNVVSYEVYVSESNTDFGEAVAVGTWADNDKVKTVIIPQTSARYIKFVAVQERGGNAWAAASEMRVGVLP